MGNPFKIIISDTHIGAGRPEIGNILEDFISDAEFLQLMRDLVRESEANQSPVELIINGDFAEMLQVPASEQYDPLKRYRTRYYEDSSEAAAIHKIRHIIQGHPGVFTGLAEFIHAGPPRRFITFTKGNHDPEQYWPGWQQVVREAIGATGDKAELLAFVPVCINREGLYIEHGNQYLGRLDSFEDFETPLDPDDPALVAHPLGSQFGVRFVNEIERDRFWVDSIYPPTAMVWYLLRWDFMFASRALATLLAAGIDVMAHKLPSFGPGDTDAEQLLGQLQDESQVEAWATRYEEDPEFRAAFNQRLQDSLELVEAVEPEPVSFGPSLLGQSDPQKMGDAIIDGAVSTLREVAQDKARETGARIVSFGHTHVAEEVPLENGALYINTGAWIWRGDFSQADEAMWRDLMENPERYSQERMLTYARIDYDDNGVPHGQLLVVDTQ